MEFQYDPQHRRHVEGWNIICLNGEDKIGLTAEEYNELARDFISNEMYSQAEECCQRGIRMGSIRSVALLGTVCEKWGQMEEAYRWYLEAALEGDRAGIYALHDLYRKGIYVELDPERAEQLRKIVEP